MKLIVEQSPIKRRLYHPFENFSNLDGAERLICASSSRVFGNMSLCYGNTEGALENRKNFLKELFIDCRDLVCAKQAHGGFVRFAKEADKGRGALSYDDAISDSDAFITDKRNLPLAVFTADCLSIFFYDAKTPAIGLIHAGWRSTKEKITQKAVQLMQEEFSVQVNDLYAGFGPAIRDCCYEVKREFLDFFP